MLRSALSLGTARQPYGRMVLFSALQFPKGGTALGLSLLAGAALLPVVGALLANSRDASLSMLTRDPATLGNLPPWAGMISTLGLIAWAGAAAACLLTAFVLRAVPGRAAVPVGWFVGAGALSLLLLMDDAFLLHEEMLPIGLGVPERVTYGVYAALALAWLVHGRRILPRTAWPLLAVSAVAFAFSTGVDVLTQDRFDNGVILAEDGTKWVGILAWFGYLTATAAHSLREAIRPA